MKFIQGFRIIFILFNFLMDSEEYRILGVFLNPEKSDNIFSQALMKILVKRGHHVDLISNFEFENDFKLEKYSGIFNLTQFFNFSNSDISQFVRDSDFAKDPLWFIFQRGNEICNLMSHEKMQNLFGELKQNSKYDLLITETFSANCYIGLGPFLKVPVITISNNLRLPWVEESIGNPKATSFIPNYLSGLTEIHHFWDRLKNSLSTLTQKFIYYIYIKKQNEIMRKYLSPDIPDVESIEKRVALTLVNSHYSLEGIKPTTSAFIEVGGLHIFEDETKLRPKLKKWMDKSTDGVVYFNLGSKLTIESLPKKVIYSLFASFAKIKPVKVLMEVNDVRKLPLELPRNIKSFRSIPQNQILGHRNTRVFITLGGILDIQEALHFGIPTIGIPISFDQILNVESLVKKNFSVRINFEELNEKRMNEALTIMLRISMKRQLAKYWSHFYRDRPLNAKQTAIYWIEYILKNGPESLKSRSVSLSWYQIELLDVYLFLLFSILFLIYSIFLIAGKMFRKLCNYTTPVHIKEA